MSALQTGHSVFHGKPAKEYLKAHDLPKKKMKGYAQGGRPPVGVPAIVGEQGPEVFVPDQPGTVIPNQQIAQPAAPAASGMTEQEMLMVEAVRRGLIPLPGSESASPSIAGDVEKSFLPGANEAIANVLGIPVDAVNSVLKAFGVGSDRPIGGSKSIKQGMDAIGINSQPVEDTTRQKILAGAGRGTGAGAVFGPAAVIPGAVGGAAGSAAGQATAALGGGEAAQLGAELVGGLASGQIAGTAQNVATKAVNMARGTVPKSNMLEVFEAEGVEPRMVGDVTGNRAAKQTTAFLKDAPFTGGIIARAAQKTIDEVDAAVDRTASNLGAATSKTDAGIAVQQGVQTFAANVGHQAERLYGALNRTFPGTTRVNASRTLGTVGDVQASLAEMQATSVALTPSLFRHIADDLASSSVGGQGPVLPNISFSAMSRLRTEVGKKLSDPMLVDDVGRADLKRIYGALSQDMRDAVAADPNAARLFDISSRYYRDQMQFIENSFQKLAAHNVTPETLFQWSTAEGRTGATRLAALRRAMGDNEFGNVSAVVLRGLGAPGGNGPFDPATFIRNWDKNLSAPAKRVLFDGDYRESIDRIAAISREMQQTGALANTSRTAGSAQLLGMFGMIGGAGAGGTVAGPAGVAVGVGVPIVAQATASKLLTSKGFARWLATDVGPGRLPHHLKLLPQVAAREPQIADEVRDFLASVAAAGDL